MGISHSTRVWRRSRTVRPVVCSLGVAGFVACFAMTPVPAEALDNIQSDGSPPREGLAGESMVAMNANLESVESSDQQTSQTAPTANGSKLEEVVVTSERRSENIEQVPISLTALSPKAMDDLHVQGFDDLAALVPGLVISTIGSNTQASSDVAIRGIFSGGNAPTTGIYIDETPIATRRMDTAGYSGSPRPDVFDLDRIEVLRGPQGTLFGAGAMGGAIRYITPQPDLHQSSGYAKAELSFTDGGSPSYNAGVAYGTPIVEGLAAFRASGWFRSSGGFIDEVSPYDGSSIRRNANTSKSYVLRPAFTVAPTESLTITPAAFIQHQHADASDQYWTNSYWSTSGLPVDTGRLLSGMGGGPTSSTDDLKIYSLAVKYELTNASIQSDSSYLDRQSHSFDDWTSVIPFFLGGPTITPGLESYSPYDENISSTRMWQQELRISSTGPSRFSWVGGAYFRRSVTSITGLGADLNPVTEALFDGATAQEAFGGVPEYSYNGQLLSAFSSFSTTDEQKAIFGEVTLGITDKLKANIGVRAEHSAVEQQRETFAGPFNGVAYTSTMVPDEVDNPVTPRVGLTYQFSESSMVYATAGKGYRAGGSNPANAIDNSLCLPSIKALGAVPNSFSSDSLWSYELGTKFSMFDRHLSVQTSVYYIDWTKIQTSIDLQSCGDLVTLNEGKAISQGFDFQIAAVPFEGVHLSANVGYVNAYFPNALLGTPDSSGVSPIIHLAGDKVPSVIPWTAAAQAEYSHPVAMFDGGRAYIRADFRWLDSISNGSPGDENIANFDPTLGRVLSDAYHVLNLRLGFAHEGLDASLFVENVTNSDPRLGYSHYGAFSATAIRPMTSGLTVLYRF